MTDPLSSPLRDPAPPAMIGPYEILGELGRGGMGTVYRARDPRLRREVALKVLHASTEDHPGRLQRFLEEARASGALNHPNILAVYDVATDAHPPYIATELIDGVTLRQMLDAGALTFPRLLDLAIQVADGLAAAHLAHLVHRDLKPENVMVTRTGRVKIVDFGLAKPAPQQDDGARTLTAAHMIVGTPRYMSPEQARGGAMDFRSDLFSFGALLYEMATGQRPFERPTTIETLTAIIHDEPQPLTELNPRMPLPLQWVVERCLAKDPGERYAATADLHHDLRALRDRAPIIAPKEGPRPGRLRRLFRPLRVALILSTLLAAAALLVTALTIGPARVDLESYRFLPFATDVAYEGSPSWSPDGRTIAYVANRDGVIQIMTRSLDSSRSAQITQAVSDCRDPFWAADGNRIFYMSRAAEREALWSVGAAGGTSRVELQDVSAAAHTPGDRARVFLREKGDEAAFTQTLWVQAPIDSEPRRFATDWVGRETAGISFLHVSPDGATVGLWANSRGGGNARNVLDSAEVWLFAFPSGQARRVLTSLGQMSRAHPFAWMPDNRRIVFGIDGLGRSPGSHLWIGDTASDRVEPLTPSATSEYEPAVSPDGQRIAYTSGASDYDLLEIPLDGSAVRPKPLIPRTVADPSWSATGQEFAYITDRSGPQEIWRSDADGSLEIPVVTERNFSDETYLLSRVAFSPDGQRLAYQRRNRGGYYVWVSPVAGGPAVQLLSDAVAIYQDAPIWSPDGSWIAFTYRDRNGNRFLGKTRPGSGGEIVTIRGDIAFPAVPRWSPDGRWILCELPDGLYALSPDGGQERLVSRELWVAHTWSRSGSEVFAVRETPENRLQLAAIDFRTLAERIVTADLGPSPPATPPLRGFSLSPDGAHILTSVVRLRGDLYLFDGFTPPDGLWARVRDALGWRRVSRKPS